MSDTLVLLPILYRDDDLVAVNKPRSLLVHRSLIDTQETSFALQILRDQIGQYVYPVHRLDKATSGVLIFALSGAAARGLSQAFADGQVQKSYLALVRGIPSDQSIDYPLKEVLDKKADSRARKDKAAQAAQTALKCLESYELPYAVDRYPTSRYSLVSAHPKTGRKHQIRRHLSHIRHPIVGDSNYGVGKHNRFFAEQFGLRRLYLSCVELSFNHPVSGEALTIKADLDHEFNAVLESLRKRGIRNGGSVELRCAGSGAR